MNMTPKCFRLGTLSLSSLLAIASLGAVSCKERFSREVEITEPRELCAFDTNELQRPQTNSFTTIQPLSWRRVAMTDFRLLNYRAGKSTEIAVGTASGSPNANIDRWYKQFKADPPADIAPLKTSPVIGAESYLVDLGGEFSTNMGGVAVQQDDWAVFGIITVLGPKDILTIKMTGPASEVAAEKDNLLEFAKNLGFIAPEKPSGTTGSNPESNPNSESK